MTSAPFFSASSVGGPHRTQASPLCEAKLHKHACAHTKSYAYTAATSQSPHHGPSLRDAPPASPDLLFFFPLVLLFPRWSLCCSSRIVPLACRPAARQFHVPLPGPPLLCVSHPWARYWTVRKLAPSSVAPRLELPVTTTPAISHILCLIQPFTLFTRRGSSPPPLTHPSPAEGGLQGDRPPSPQLLSRPTSVFPGLVLFVAPSFFSPSPPLASPGPSTRPGRSVSPSSDRRRPQVPTSRLFSAPGQP